MTTLEVVKNEVTIQRFNKYINNRVETHLEFTVFFRSADGRIRWVNGMMDWGNYCDAETLIHDVLALKTSFVRQNWVRIEVCIPNRNSYGQLESGYIKDTGLLLATRT